MAPLPRTAAGLLEDDTGRALLVRALSLSLSQPKPSTPQRTPEPQPTPDLRLSLSLSLSLTRTASQRWTATAAGHWTSTNAKRSSAYCETAIPCLHARLHLNRATLWRFPCSHTVALLALSRCADLGLAPPRDDKIEQLFAMCDRDESGQLDLAEFEAFFKFVLRNTAERAKIVRGRRVVSSST
eukprot:scaffold70798_cov64-Phaeocystis_antarctica.AAC.4